MKITESNLKRIIKKNLLEMAMDFDTEDRPSPGIQDRAQSGDTPLKKVPMPSTGREPDHNFQELLASERYRSIVQKVRRYSGLQPNQTIQGSQPTLIRSAFQAKQQIESIESQHIDELSQLAIDLVSKEMGVPEGSVQWDCKIEQPSQTGFEHDSKEENPSPPNIENEVEGEEILAGDLENFNLERAKRRLINAMIQGSAAKGHYMFNLVVPELVRITGDDTIIGKYGLLMSILDTQYWQYDDEVIHQSAGSSMEGEEKIDTTTDPPTIYARGTNFPILVHEIIKGLMELLGSQGQPEDQEMFQQIMKLEDTLEKEVWDMRLGPPLWERIRASFPDEVLHDENLYLFQNYILVEILKLPAKKFLVLTREIMSESQESKRLVREIYESLRSLLDDEEPNDEFSSYLDELTKNTSNEEIVEFVNTSLKRPGDDATNEEWDAYLDQLLDQRDHKGNENGTTPINPNLNESKSIPRKNK